MAAEGWLVGIAFFLLLTFVYSQIILLTRYKRCGPDEILVVFGKVADGKSSRCIHGGGTLVWPLVQDYRKLSLIPMTIHIPLPGALSQDKIRINVSSTFTVGISTEPTIMNNAAERLLHLTQDQIEEMASEIIFGQLRQTVASLTIEQINQDRDNFLELIRDNIECELNKIGIHLIHIVEAIIDSEITDLVTEEKLNHYLDLTSRAREKATPIHEEGSVESSQLEIMLKMADDYASDAKHFMDKGDYVRAFGAINYAHAWIDAGVKLRLLDGHGDDELFTLP